jgi:hypothetical protein
MKRVVLKTNYKQTPLIKKQKKINLRTQKLKRVVLKTSIKQSQLINMQN